MYQHNHKSEDTPTLQGWTRNCKKGSTSGSLTVTRLAWIAHKLVSSKRPTRYASEASWRARTAWLWKRRSVLKSWAISLEEKKTPEKRFSRLKPKNLTWARHRYWPTTSMLLNWQSAINQTKVSKHLLDHHWTSCGNSKICWRWRQHTPGSRSAHTKWTPKKDKIFESPACICWQPASLPTLKKGWPTCQHIGLSLMKKVHKVLQKIYLTSLWKGSLRMRSSVDFWYFLISRRATVPACQKMPSDWYAGFFAGRLNLDNA